MRIRLLCPISALVASLLLGCAAAKPRPALPSAAAVTLAHGDGRVGEYVSSWNGFRTSSYWIEGPDGLILIDTQFLLSAAEEMIDWAEQATGKKAVLAIVLHPNPDKFNGTAVFQRRGIRVVTSEQVLKLITAVHRLRLGWFYDRFKPDYPRAEPKPEAFGNATTELRAAGITLKAHVLGAGCSGAHVVVEYGKSVFVGDLVTQGFHSWLELGMLDEWLKRLEEIQALGPETVYTGRGGYGDSSLLEREADYLRTVIAIVRAHHPRPGAALRPEAAEAITREIVARYPSYDYPKFVENGLEEVWKRLASQRR